MIVWMGSEQTLEHLKIRRRRNRKSPGPVLNAAAHLRVRTLEISLRLKR